MILTFAFCITLIQLSTAQVFSFNPRNSQPNVIQGQHAHNIPQNNLNTVLANNRASIARPLPYGNINNLFNSNTNLNLANAQLVNTELANAELENAKFANTQLANAEIANARLANAQITNAELANAKFANSQIAKAQLANAELANAKFANAQFANAELTNAKYANAQINNAEIANTRALQSNWLNRNVYADKTNLENPNLGLNALNALSNLASINGNVATFNLGNGGPHAFTVISGSPNSPGFGIQLMSDALEVGGTVAVTGQMPIFGTVAVNGNLPTDGSASVNYSCRRPETV